MKCEQPGSRYKNTIQIHEPGMLPQSLQDEIEEFRFPRSKFSSNEEREEELYYDRLYIPRSIYVVYYSPAHPTQIEAVARIIEKRSKDDKLPVEYSRVVSVTEHSSLNEKRNIEGEYFPVEYYDPRLPVCEIGGLHAAEIDEEKGITIKSRYRAIDAVMKECDRQVHIRKYASFFLTCAGVENMKRLYHDKFFFEEVAQISWGGSRTWKALWRVPFANIKREINYSVFA